MSHTPDGAEAPARSRRRLPRSINSSAADTFPIDPGKRRIKIAGAVALIGRSKCPVAVALRAVGLDRDHNAREDVAGLLDLRGIPRIKLGVRRVRFPVTPSQTFEAFIPPRRNYASTHNSIAAMAAELVAIADPLAPEVPTNKSSRPTITFRCRECGVPFEGRRNTARYCGGACRIKHWREEQ